MVSYFIFIKIHYFRFTFQSISLKFSIIRNYSVKVYFYLKKIVFTLDLVLCFIQEVQEIPKIP